MAAASVCPICMDDFKRGFNNPITLMPCGHVVCDPCWNQERPTQHQIVQNCPHCRARTTGHMINTSLLEIIEHTHADPKVRIGRKGSSHPGDKPYVHDHVGAGVDPLPGNAIRTLYTSARKRTQFEVLSDRCEAAWYVLDNSGSMDVLDGKVFEQRADGSVFRRNYVSRFAELCNKTGQIARYNLRRGVKAAYYLLNPKGTEWRENIDFVVLDPNDDTGAARFNLLMSQILSPSNIRGSTPLHTATAYFSAHLREFVDSEHYQHVPICLNILTDGEPDTKDKFERNLRKLVAKHHVFLCINLCTDEESVIDYYNDLDRKLGTEISGVDVVDDMDAEATEIKKAGNNFFVYTYDFHIARMAGCYSVAADMLDEQRLPVHYMGIFCKELVITTLHANDRRISSKSEIAADVPHYSDRVAFTHWLVTNAPLVYSSLDKRFKPLINAKKVGRAIWWREQKRQLEGWFAFFTSLRFWVGLLILSSVLYLGYDDGTGTHSSTFFEL